MSFTLPRRLPLLILVYQAHSASLSGTWFPRLTLLILVSQANLRGSLPPPPFRSASSMMRTLFKPLHPPLYEPTRPSFGPLLALFWPALFSVALFSVAADPSIVGAHHALGSVLDSDRPKRSWTPIGPSGQAQVVFHGRGLSRSRSFTLKGHSERSL